VYYDKIDLARSVTIVYTIPATYKFMRILILQRLFVEAILDVFYFPIWWYSGGLKHAAQWCLNLLKAGNFRLAPLLWLQNIAIPMYGQYDWQGRAVSFFMRLVQVIIRSFLLFLWLTVCLLLFSCWLLLPLLTLAGIYLAFTFL
jgi:hypothetical protein